MIIKTLLVGICFIAFSFISFAQDAHPEVKKVYSESEIATLKSNAPEKINLLNYAVNNAFEIVNFPKEKSNEVSNSIEIENLNALSFEEINIQIQDVNQYFKIKGEDKMLLVKSFHLLEYEMKKNKK